jgi:predicted enzyme related to lactoylglutathione lyase
MISHMKPLFQKVDAIVVRVASLDEGLKFYSDTLGHKLRWRNDTMAGMAMGDSDTELVLSVNTGPETDILVNSVDDAVLQITQAGGTIVLEPEEIPVGKVAIVRDPFGNLLTLLDLSKGQFDTDQSGFVTGVSKS